MHLSRVKKFKYSAGFYNWENWKLLTPHKSFLNLITIQYLFLPLPLQACSKFLKFWKALHNVNNCDIGLIDARQCFYTCTKSVSPAKWYFNSFIKLFWLIISSEEARKALIRSCQTTGRIIYSYFHVDLNASPANSFWPPVALYILSATVRCTSKLYFWLFTFINLRPLFLKEIKKLVRRTPVITIAARDFLLLLIPTSLDSTELQERKKLPLKRIDAEAFSERLYVVEFAVTYWNLSSHDDSLSIN